MLDFWTGDKDLAVYGFLIRALIIYVYMFIIIKVLGQRSIGTINPLDFLFAVIIGDVLGEPLSSGEIPLKGPVAAAGLISILHLSFSLIAINVPRFRRVIDDEPIVLIENGIILPKIMKKTKITVESLMQDLRLREASDLTEVDYAILESNGQISVIKKSNAYPSVLIQDGHIIHANVKKFGTLQWLQNQLQKKGINDAKEVFLLTMDKGGNIYFSKK